MKEINAFVGHSFTEDDESLVQKFVKYFDQLKDSNSSFSWTHAEKAEPKQLADKVLALIKEANVFIGICTKKELVVQQKDLRRDWWRRHTLVGHQSKFEWKTSDWIIQEIGLAIGKELDLILFVEEGLKKPGGIQGNVEYITFSRENLEKPFGKFLEMISAISPRTASPIAETSSKDFEKPDQKEISPSEHLKSPKADWSEVEYQDALLFALATNHLERAETISKAYRDSEISRVGSKRTEWEARTQYYRILFSKGGDFDKLAELANNFASNSIVVQMYANSLEHYEKFSEAAMQFHIAATAASDVEHKASLLREAAVNFRKSDDVAAMNENIVELKELATSSEQAEVHLLNALRSIAEIEKRSDIAIAAMERIIEIRPDNFDIRFELAYKHSQTGKSDVALHHYLKIPDSARNQTTWNNLGVSYNEFDMPTKSVKCYRKSESMGETLAMSNLGYKLIAAGFIDEAKDICDTAMATDHYHKNVGHLVARINDVPDEESEKEKNVLAKAKPKIDFFKIFGRGLSRITPTNFSKKWRGPSGALDLVIVEGSLKLSGQYTVEMSNIISALMGAGHATAKAPENFTINYEGKLEGLAFRGTVTRLKVGEVVTAATILGINDKEKKVLMVFSDDLKSLKVTEDPDSQNPQFYIIKAE